MALTKTDLQAIRRIIKGEINPIKSDLSVLKKDIKKIDKKFDKLFGYLDRDVSYFKRKTAQYFGVDVSKLSPPAR
jgi:hypothetical protein